MTYTFISETELKNDGFINNNVETEYIDSAISEAQTIYLKELLGDALYTVMVNKINGSTLSGKYETLEDEYIKPYLKYKVLSLLCVPITMKIRNAGVVSQYSSEINSASLDDTKYMESFYNEKAEFFANRMTTYLEKNHTDIKEYAYSSENVTNPTQSQSVGSIYLGGRKKGCNGHLNLSGGSTTTVDWDNITNRPTTAPITLVDENGVTYTLNVYKK